MNDTGTRSERLLVNTNEAARMLSIAPRTLWSLTASGEIPSIRIGRSVRYDPGDLRVWIEAQKAGSRG